jgi:hypothetical protein
MKEMEGGGWGGSEGGSRRGMKRGGGPTESDGKGVRGSASALRLGDPPELYRFQVNPSRPLSAPWSAFVPLGCGACAVAARARVPRAVEPALVLRQRGEQGSQGCGAAAALRGLEVRGGAEENVGPRRLCGASAHVRVGVGAAVGEAPAAEGARAVAAREGEAPLPGRGVGGNSLCAFT